MESRQASSRPAPRPAIAPGRPAPTSTTCGTTRFIGATVTHRGERGFTLLELVMVMLLLCVVAAMATPALRGFSEGRKVGSCAAQMVAVAHWGRTQAVTRGVAFRLNVDPATNTFWLTEERLGVFVNPGEEFGRTFTAPDGVTLRWYGPLPTVGSGTTFPFVEFLPTGRTTAAASVEIADDRGSIVEVGCRTPGEPLRALADWERSIR